ncbi:MAG: antitoxin family protein [Anaerolineae bacterium]
MTETIEALFDGVVLRPTQPLTLKPNTRVWIVVETTPPATQSTSFLRTARALNLEGPADWSANFEKYLYGDANHDET